MHRHRSTAALLALGLLCTALAAKAAPPTPVQPGTLNPGTVQGVALDARGRPLAGVTVWVMPSVAQGWVAPGVSSGVLQLRTDAQGRYHSPRLPDQPYNVYAWQRVTSGGQQFCLPLAAAQPNGNAPFSGRQGAVRNFRWQLTGEMPDAAHDHAFYGAELRLMNGGWDGTAPLTRDSQVEVTLLPDGPLIDGSAGKPIVRRVSFYDGFLYDLPLGRYRASAVELRPDGSRLRLVMNASGDFQTSLDFKAVDGSCGGYGGSNGIERAFLDLARPQP